MEKRKRIAGSSKPRETRPHPLPTTQSNPPTVARSCSPTAARSGPPPVASSHPLPITYQPPSPPQSLARLRLEQHSEISSGDESPPRKRRRRVRESCTMREKDELFNPTFNFKHSLEYGDIKGGQLELGTCTAENMKKIPGANDSNGLGDNNLLKGDIGGGDTYGTHFVSPLSATEQDVVENMDSTKDQFAEFGEFNFNDPQLDELISTILQSAPHLNEHLNDGDSNLNTNDMEQTMQRHENEVQMNTNVYGQHVEGPGIDDVTHDESCGDEMDDDDLGEDDMDDGGMDDGGLGDDEIDADVMRYRANEDDYTEERDDRGSPLPEIGMHVNRSGGEITVSTNYDDDGGDRYGFYQDNVNVELHSDDNSSGDDGERRRGYKDFRSPTLDQVPNFEIGMKFGNKKEFRKAVTLYRTLTGRQLLIRHNDKKRLRVKCKGHDCKFLLYAKKVEALNSPDFVLVTMNPGHSDTCMPQFDKNKIPAEWVAERFMNRFQANVKTPVRQIRVFVDEQYKTEIFKSKAYRARSLAKEKIEGNICDQYSILWNYGEELKRTNPNTTIKIKFAPRVEQERNPRFMRWYCCFGPLKQGFLDVCRPVIFVDGCFTRGLFKGQVLAALRVDPINGFWPISWAVVEKEAKQQWLWFLKKLMKDLGITESNSSSYTLMSDQQKGLGAAITELMPGADKRYCVQHMYKNFKASHPGKEMKDKFWSIANSTTEESFNKKMEELKMEHPNAWDNVTKAAPKDQWVKAFFPIHTKCDTLVNNTCESFNAKIVDAREQPIISMLETFRLYCMDRIRRRGEWGRKNNHLLTPAARNVLVKNYKASVRWKAISNGAGGYEVKGWGNQQFVVYPRLKSCTCRGWQLSGIPCPHAIVCILKLGENPSNYVDDNYLQSQFNKLYDHVLQPINGVDMWPKSQKPTLDPPYNLKQTGRPPIIKRVEAVETIDPNGTIRMKRHIVSHCSNCGETGHNVKTCKKGSVADMRHGFGVPQPSHEDEPAPQHQEQPVQQIENLRNNSKAANGQLQQTPIPRRVTRQHVASSSRASPNAATRGRGSKGRGISGGKIPKTDSDKIRENENAEYLGSPPPHRIGRWARKNLSRVP